MKKNLVHCAHKEKNGQQQGFDDAKWLNEEENETQSHELNMNHFKKPTKNFMFSVFNSSIN